MLSEEDVRSAGIACDPIDHDGYRCGDCLDRRPIRTLGEERGDLAEHVIADAIPRSNEQLVARLEVLVEVPIVQACAGAYSAHSDRGPTALTPNLGCGLDQLLPSFCTTLGPGPTTPALISRPHLSILTKRPVHDKTGGMRHQWWLMPPDESSPTSHVNVATRKADR